MTEQRPRVSIGLPVYNGEEFLEKALDSLLAQTFSDFEIVICDNASTDRTAAICHRYASQDARVRYHRNEHNLGAARNYNRVFELSRGEYFKWAAHDDVCAPEFLQRCVELLDREPQVVLCYTTAQVIDRHGKPLRVRSAALDIRAACPAERLRQYGAWLPVATVIHPVIFGVARRQALAATGLIGAYISSDQVILAELALLGEFRELPEPLFSYRWHASSSVNANREFLARLRWFDPELKPRLLFPHFRLLLEYRAAVRRITLTRTQKLRCHRLVVAQLRWRWKSLLRECVINTAMALGLHRIPIPRLAKRLPRQWGSI